MSFGDSTKLSCHVGEPPTVVVKRFGEPGAFRTLELTFKNNTEFCIFVQEADWDAFKQAIADAFIEDSLKDVGQVRDAFMGELAKHFGNTISRVAAAEVGLDDHSKHKGEHCCNGCCQSASF